ncbi:hypothetical protein HZS_3875 [Henneguya salminicola]|nr:hypothetical protein HZS_3875 [Henneguya salminicola]
MYLPIVFGLMQDRSSWYSWHFIHFCFVLSSTKIESEPQKWDEFWKYFNNVWLKNYTFSSWNISKITEKEQTHSKILISN